MVGEIRGVPMPIATIATASPSMSWLIVVETPPAVDNDRRPKGHTPYGATRSDQRAAGLGSCKRGQKDKLVWEFENREVE